MMLHRVAVRPGNGIRREVTGELLQVLRAVAPSLVSEEFSVERHAALSCGLELAAGRSSQPLLRRDGRTFPRPESQPETTTKVLEAGPASVTGQVGARPHQFRARHLGVASDFEKLRRVRASLLSIACGGGRPGRACDGEEAAGSGS